jgi:hypothetical protein
MKRLFTYLFNMRSDTGIEGRNLYYDVDMSMVYLRIYAVLYAVFDCVFTSRGGLTNRLVWPHMKYVQIYSDFQVTFLMVYHVYNYRTVM